MAERSVVYSAYVDYLCLSQTLPETFGIRVVSFKILSGFGLVLVFLGALLVIVRSFFHARLYFLM
jgi:hypothetical protein